jgi:hypothetical protein
VNLDPRTSGGSASYDGARCWPRSSEWGARCPSRTAAPPFAEEIAVDAKALVWADVNGDIWQLAK